MMSVPVSIALVIGSMELIGVLADQANIISGSISGISGISLDYAGYAIVDFSSSSG